MTDTQNEPFLLASLAPQRRQRGPLLVLIAALVLLVVGGAGILAWVRIGGDDPAPSVGQTQAAATSPSTSQPGATQAVLAAHPDDPDGEAACADVKAWHEAGAGSDLERLRTIGERATRSTQGSVRMSGALIVAQAKLEAGQPSAPKTTKLGKDLYDTCQVYHYL